MTTYSKNQSKTNVQMSLPLTLGNLVLELTLLVTGLYCNAITADVVSSRCICTAVEGPQSIACSHVLLILV